MMRFWSVSLLSTLCLISQPIGAMTIDYDTVFPTVIQGHTDNMSSNCNSAEAERLLARSAVNWWFFPCNTLFLFDKSAICASKFGDLAQPASSAKAQSRLTVQEKMIG